MENEETAIESGNQTFQHLQIGRAFHQALKSLELKSPHPPDFKSPTPISLRKPSLMNTLKETLTTPKGKSFWLIFLLIFITFILLILGLISQGSYTKKNFTPTAYEGPFTPLTPGQSHLPRFLKLPRSSSNKI